MNDDYPLDDVLRAWADAGEEQLPAPYLDAALAQIETTRQRGARWAPLEDFIMRFQALAAPVAVVAVLVMAVVAFALLTGPPNVGPETTSNPSPTAIAVTPSPTPESTPEPTASPTPAPSPSAAATRLLDAGWSLPFTMTVPSDWQRDQLSSDSVYKIDTGVDTATGDVYGQWLFLYAPEGSGTAEDRLTSFTSNPQLVTTDVEAVELGGSSGYRLDIRLNPDDPPDPRGCPRFPSCHLITAGAGGWYILPDRATRLWIVDVGDQTVLIGTQAVEASFDDWAVQAEAAVSTVRWE